MNMIAERRRFIRYKMADDAFAALNCPATIVGKLRDLSMGSASFEFIAAPMEEMHTPGQQTLDIFLLGGIQGLSQVPCQIFFRLPAEHFEDPGRVLFPVVVSRICVAEFQDLSQEQSRTLLDFLMHHSTGAAA
jgi:hypothetical protein